MRQSQSWLKNHKILFLKRCKMQTTPTTERVLAWDSTVTLPEHDTLDKEAITEHATLGKETIREHTTVNTETGLPI